jgi:hypothetical protein
MRRGKDIHARGSSGKAGGVIRHCRKVKDNRGSVFQPTLRMAGLPIMLCYEKPPSEPGGSDAMARRSGDLIYPRTLRTPDMFEQLASNDSTITAPNGGAADRLTEATFEAA